MVLLILAQVDMFIGSFANSNFGSLYVDQITNGTYYNIDGDQRAAYGYTGWSLETAGTNLWAQYTAGPMNSNPDEKSSFMEVGTKVFQILWVCDAHRDDKSGSCDN